MTVWSFSRRGRRAERNCPALCGPGRRATIRELAAAWEPGQASALDRRRIAAGADVGNVTVRRMTAAGPVDAVHTVDFAFAFRAFFPEGQIHTGHTEAAP